MAPRDGVRGPYYTFYPKNVWNGPLTPSRGAIMPFGAVKISADDTGIFNKCRVVRDL